MIPVEQNWNDYQFRASWGTAPILWRSPWPQVNGLKPMEYQQAGAEYCLARDHALIGDAPGLGKTVEAILITNAMKAKRTLVVCPASLRLNWVREIWRWSTTPNVSVDALMSGKQGFNDKADWTVVSYDLLRNAAVMNALLTQFWDHCVLDEAHYLKNPDGNTRIRPICAPDMLPSMVGRFTMLSGTILPNQPIECYNAIRLLNWEAINRASLQSFQEFYYGLGEGFVRMRVLDPETQVWASKVVYSDQVRNVPQNLDDLQYRLRKHVMVRRLKEQVLTQLPPKEWHLFPLEKTKGIKEALAHPGWARAQALYDMSVDQFDSTALVDGAISTARRLLGEAKAHPIADYIEDMLLSGYNKLVVGAWHISVLAILRERLAEYGLTYMDGSTSPKAKQKAVDDFQNRDDVSVILGQVQTLGEGWTLTKAQDVIDVEPDWRPGVNDQLLDRVHRMGQMGPYVLGHIPVVPSSLDERIIARNVEKARTIYQALDADHSA